MLRPSPWFPIPGIVPESFKLCTVQVGLLLVTPVPFSIILVGYDPEGDLGHIDDFSTHLDDRLPWSLSVSTAQPSQILSRRHLSVRQWISDVSDLIAPESY